ncbi:MAG: cyclodeaminase [Ruegeria sp.]
MAHDIQIVTEAELRAAVKLDLTVVDVVEQAFVALASGTVVMPPIMSMDLPMVNADVDVKTAYVLGFEGFALKVSTGFFDNAKLGLPSLGGLMTLFSATGGHVMAVYLDNGYLTDVRTAAAGAVAARHLAPAVVETAGVMGTGLQARLQMQAAHLVRPFNRLLVWGRDDDKARICARDMSELLGIEAEAVTDPAVLVRESQLVVTTTPAREPIIRAEWLHPGLHITAMGSDAEAKNEIEAAALVQADLYVADSVAQTRKLGELRSAIDAGLWQGEDPPELGEIITGAKPGRVTEQDVTICDLTGTGAQDTAIATHVSGQIGDAGTTISS